MINKIQYIKDYQPSLWQIPSAKLDFLIKTKNIVVTSKLEIRKEDKNITQINLDGENLQFMSLKIDGKKASNKNYQVDKNGLQIFGLPKKKDSTLFDSLLKYTFCLSIKSTTLDLAPKTV